MEFNTSSPIWMQVATRIKTDMVTGRLPPGAKLPGGRDLALQYTINPNTAARVYQELEKEGLVEIRRGMGTYVTETPERLEALRSEMAREAMEDYLERMAALGFSRAEAITRISQEDEHAQE